ncbi:GNAT family N-acetyltransferase [Ktedonospora formicarum]|uniref:N-acetyltransferase n=1 Tax=Ktedonospora formicarum TaxID=2778364 RepID=A0A8J3HSE6_9CHLR|nr:GNAT family N-acetyltransferase [Ktedonospora formicarum]GHO42411.1 N-acetyltransferase [Ktedonospora formicarum]
MQNLIQIRPAQPGDAERAALLLHSAYTHTHVTYPPQDIQESGFITRLQDFFRQNTNRFSYQHIQVAEQNSEVVGVILSFGGRTEVDLNTAIGNWLEREALDDEWYIDALAVFQNWGRQGIGACLLHSAERQALQHHYSKIALHVAQENTAALDLYTRLGYIVTQQAVLYQRPHIRMVKKLDHKELGINE